MVDGTSIQNNFAQVVSNIGMPVSVKYFTKVFSSGTYDDEPSYTVSGTTLWTSGIVQPISFGTKNSSVNSALLEQGIVVMSDKILYLQSGLNFVNNSKTAIQVGIGSPSTQFYSLLPEAVQEPVLIGGKVCYQKLYIRQLTTGSIVD